MAGRVTLRKGVEWQMASSSPRAKAPSRRGVQFWLRLAPEGNQRALRLCVSAYLYFSTQTHAHTCTHVCVSIVCARVWLRVLGLLFSIRMAAWRAKVCAHSMAIGSARPPLPFPLPSPARLSRCRPHAGPLIITHHRAKLDGILLYQTELQCTVPRC